MNQPGICYVCGCTHDVPCPSGCGWVNGDENFCTSCAELEPDQLAVLMAVKQLYERQWRVTPEKVAAALGFSIERTQMGLQQLEAAELIVHDNGWMTHAQYESMFVDL